jgi:hypothetical protein
MTTAANNPIAQAEANLAASIANFHKAQAEMNAACAAYGFKSAELAIAEVDYKKSVNAMNAAKRRLTIARKAAQA